MLTHVHGRPSASSGSQSVATKESTPSTSSTSGDAPQSPGTEDFDTQLEDFLLQNSFDDGTLYGRISDGPSSPSDLEAAYEARARAKIEAFNADFHNARE